MIKKKVVRKEDMDKKVVSDFKRIKPDDVDNFLRFVRLEQEVLALMQFYKESEELQLKRMERLKEVTGLLAQLKLMNNNFKVDEWTKRELRRIAGSYTVMRSL